MSVDAQRLMDVVTYLHMLWSAPVQILISLVFLYQTMGASVFAGFVVMLLMIPINAVIASISRKFQVSVVHLLYILYTCGPLIKDISLQGTLFLSHLHALLCFNKEHLLEG